jgi:hypothetical protein
VLNDGQWQVVAHKHSDDAFIHGAKTIRLYGTEPAKTPWLVRHGGRPKIKATETPEPQSIGI